MRRYEKNRHDKWEVVFYSFILAIFPPNPQGERKERSHGRLGIFKTSAENREPMTICHKNEEVCTSDSDTA